VKAADERRSVKRVGMSRVKVLTCGALAWTALLVTVLAACASSTRSAGDTAASLSPSAALG
jgi:hypothetical protein